MNSMHRDESKICIGAMSGTSLDGVDASVFAFSQTHTPSPRFELLKHVHMPFDASLRDQLVRVCQGEAITVATLGLLDHQVALTYVKAIELAITSAHLQSDQIHVIGAHGQTVHHQPTGAYRYTMQIGDGNLMAVRTGIPVVTDFRRRDMALGGQGAPLAPSFHQWVLRDPLRCRMVVNLGGIANLTVLSPGSNTRGFDTGPANILMDAWIERHRQKPYDQDGAWARGGQVITSLLQGLLNDDYFLMPPPKSTGRELFNLHWLDKKLAQQPQAIDVQDVQRTLLELTAVSVATAICNEPTTVGDVVVCGGGARNLFLMERLTSKLQGWNVNPSDAFGIPSQAMETLAFALFALRTMQGQPSSEPLVTGAQRSCLLGNIYRT